MSQVVQSSVIRVASNQTIDPASPSSASAGEMHTWALGSFADYWMYAQFAAIMAIFTTTFGLDKRYVGIALFFPRIVDALIDPFVGHLSDITHTRWGRRRPFILVTGVIGAVLSSLIWWPSVHWPQWVQFVWLTVGAILLFSTWGTYTMAHNALGYELSDDYNDRSRVFAIKGVYFAAMAVGGGYFWWAAMKLGDLKAIGGEINGVRLLSLLVSAIILASAFAVAFYCRERFASANRKHVSLWRACVDTLKCRPYVVLLFLQIARTLGTSLYGVLSLYIGIYYVCNGDKKLYSMAQMGLGGVVGFVFSVILWPMAKPLTRHMGKRWGLIITFGISFVYALALPFITLPGRIYLLVITGFALIFPMTMQNLFLTSIMPDICDIDELKSGERREGLFSAVQSFVSKVEISLCTLLGMFLLSFIGFDEKLPQQREGVMTHMLWWAFVPKIIFSGVALLIAFYMPITEQMMMKVREQLIERRKQPDTTIAHGFPVLPAAAK